MRQRDGTRGACFKANSVTRYFEEGSGGGWRSTNTQTMTISACSREYCASREARNGQR
jgi:hypothetical protein